MPERIYPIAFLPGLKKDGTSFASRHYLDGLWCRFQRGLPRKMGGYQEILSVPERPRGMIIVPEGNEFRVMVGDRRGVGYFLMNEEGTALGGMIDRTPDGFVASDQNTWQFQTLYMPATNTWWLLAHATPSLDNIASPVETPVYAGNLYEDTPLEPLKLADGTPLLASGGIVVLSPYLFVFGNGGLVRWSKAGDPFTFPLQNFAVVCPRKIVRGMPARGGKASPAGLLWSLDSLIRVMFEPNHDGTPNFRFDTLTSESSILSANSVVEYDGLYFWAGVDRFLFYGGTVQEVANMLNLDYFYVNTPESGVNYDQRQKAWATKIPQYGEIWWFYPSGTADECDRAVIFNVREKCWYSTDIEVEDDGRGNLEPVRGRGCGYFEQVFADPVWASNENKGGAYTIWKQETGMDKVWADGTVDSIPSSFRTGDLTWCAMGPEGGWNGIDRKVSLIRIEPDFKMTGKLNVSAYCREYAQSPLTKKHLGEIKAETQKIDTMIQAREMSLQFESADTGTSYEMGQVLLTLTVGDGRA